MRLDLKNLVGKTLLISQDFTEKDQTSKYLYPRSKRKMTQIVFITLLGIAVEAGQKDLRLSTQLDLVRI